MKSVAEPDEKGNANEEVDFSRQINLEVYTDNAQKLLDVNNQ